MSAYGGELFTSYSAVEARREWEIGMIKERLSRNEKVDTAVCRVERVSATSGVLRFGLKRGKLLYLFKYPHHDVEREKHRNVITRARFIKYSLEASGYTLIPWDFKKGQPPTFWTDEQERIEGTMEEEDDDLYGPSETTAAKQEVKDDSDGGDEPMDEAESGEEEDSDDSDSDLEIILDKPQTAAKPVAQAPQEPRPIKIEAPPQVSATPAQQQKASASNIPSLPLQSGASYPAVKTSNIDVNADPIYPPVGKPVSQIDIDADLAESTKPWRLPGADQSDYFNYGFDEFTWEMYRQRQDNMASTLSNQKAETAQFQQMFMPGMPQPGGGGGAGGGGGGGGQAAGLQGVPAGPSASGGMPGMPGMSEEQMQMMMAQMQASGMDMGNMDFNTFMQMAGGMGGGFPGGPQQGQQQQGYGGGGAGQAGGGGRGGGGRRGRGGW